MIKAKKKTNKLLTLMIILLSFAVIIFLGALLLSLPISQKVNLSFIDALFLSTSAVCVTGLSPVIDVGATLTLFGEIVLACLIEIGGLGIVTLVMFIAVLLGFKISVNQRVLLKEALNHNAIGGIIILLKKIVITTLIIQLFGSILNFISFYFIEGFPLLDSIGYSVFHSISSFNNAGFDLFGSNSLIDFSNNILLNISTCLMIFCGGIGFIVIFDVLQNKKFKKLSLHSKIVIIFTLILLVISTLLIKFMNNNISWLQAIFLSFTTRTAGFTTVDLNTLSSASILIIILLMFIGAAPSSTGGGIKVTTFFTMLVSLKSFARGDEQTNVFRRRIPSSQVKKSFILTTFSLFIIFITATIILAIEQSNFELHKVIFEVFSAFSTTGLTMGITPELTSASKLLLCFAMYFGRLGPITFISLLQDNEVKVSIDTVKYVEEEIIIG